MSTNQICHREQIGALISNVNFKLEARQTVIDDYCTVTTDNNLALQGGTLNAGYCLFEWNNTAGYSIDGFKVEGIASIQVRIVLATQFIIIQGRQKQKS